MTRLIYNGKVGKFAVRIGIILRFLPTYYNPNLNPIERAWKIMNEHVRNNQKISLMRFMDFLKLRGQRVATNL